MERGKEYEVGNFFLHISIKIYLFKSHKYEKRRAGALASVIGAVEEIF
ncbi:MAG: hypothetical protein ACXQTS_06605 [Candidatus Methanospirareceae archaeon]